MYNLLLAFGAIFRNIDLSLDRARWGNWADLRDYYHSEIDLNRLMETILKEINSIDVKKETSIKKNPFQDIVRKFMRNDRNATFARNIHEYYSLLQTFLEVLNRDISVCDKIAELYRQRIATTYFNNIRRELTKTDFNKTLKVEHYLANPILNTVEVSFFFHNFQSNTLK